MSDFFNYDAFVNDVIVVTRRVEDETYVLNMFKNEEARELYNKLIGENNERI